MDNLVVILLCVLAGVLLGQVPLVLLFIFVLRKGVARAERSWEPKVAVVLCLRGPDPFLGDCIRAVLAQEYPRYELHIVVDSEQDPAHAIARDLCGREAGHRVRITVLSERGESCTLKCSSVVQAVRQLDESFDVVALVDADTVPHPTWLRELVAPLGDDSVGATTGNRWYMPDDSGWGSLIRYVWNGAAVVQMFCYRIPWGGSLALKTHVVRDSDLLDKWSNAFCEDTMLYRELRTLGLSVRFVPSLMMVNREQCSIGGYYRWVRRQLLTARLYHPGFKAVVGHGVITFLVPVVAVVLAAWAASRGDWHRVAWTGGGMAAYELGLVLLLVSLERAVRRTVSVRGDSTRWISWTKAWKLLPAMVLTQLVYTAALAGALTTRLVDWRGVQYRIGGPWKIQLVKYIPYAAGDEVEGKPTSL